MIELPLPWVRPEHPKSARVFATWWVKSTLNSIICVYCWSHDLESTLNPEQAPIRGTRFIIARHKVPHIPFHIAIHFAIAW